MKKLLIAALAVTAFAATAHAGGIVTVTPDVVIIEDTAASNQGIFVPILTLLFILLAYS